MLCAFRENFGENFRRERPKIAHSRSRKTRMKPRKTGNPLPKSQLDFESFSLRPLRYISKYIFTANLRFVYRKSALKLGTVAVRILLENASFRQALKPVRTSKLTFPRVIWRHPAKHPLGFRVTPLRPLEYSSVYSVQSLIIITKNRRAVNVRRRFFCKLFCGRGCAPDAPAQGGGAACGTGRQRRSIPHRPHGGLPGAGRPLGRQYAPQFPAFRAGGATAIPCRAACAEGRRHPPKPPAGEATRFSGRPAARPARLSGRAGGFRFRQRSRRRGPPAWRPRSPRRGGRAGGAAPCSRALRRPVARC